MHTSQKARHSLWDTLYTHNTQGVYPWLHHGFTLVGLSRPKRSLSLLPVHRRPRYRSL